MGVWEEEVKLELTEEEVKILLKILKTSNPSTDEQKAVFNLVQFLEHILKS